MSLKQIRKENMTEDELDFLRSFLHTRFSAVNPEDVKKIRGMLHFTRSKVLYYKNPRSSETQAISDIEIDFVIAPSGSYMLRYWTEDGKEGQHSSPFMCAMISCHRISYLQTSLIINSRESK